MQLNIHPCIWFDGEGLDAANFYCSIFKNSAIKSSTPIMVDFTINGQPFKALNGGPMFKANPSISFTVSISNKDQAASIWNSFVNEGKIMMPLQKYPWSELYGWVEDQFGISWQINWKKELESDCTITPSLLFTGNNLGKAKHAIDYYRSIFKDSTADTIALFPENDLNAGMIQYAAFTLNSRSFIIMDSPGHAGLTFNEAISFVVECKDQQEIDYFWNSLTEEGTEIMCGWLKDKYGICWQIIPEHLGQILNQHGKSKEAMSALQKMKKINIQQLMNI